MSKTLKDVHEDDYSSNKNLLKQLFLLDTARLKIDKLKRKPDIIFALRDDLLWKSSCNFVKIFETVAKSNTYFTSSYYWNNGVCERFFIANYSVAITILGRIHQVISFLNEVGQLSYVKPKGLNGEWLMRYILEIKKIDITALPIVTPRVRVNGKVKNDLLLPRPWRLGCFVRSQVAKMKYHFLYRKK